MNDLFRLVVPCHCMEYSLKNIETIARRDGAYQNGEVLYGYNVTLNSEVTKWLNESNIRLRSKHPNGRLDALLIFESKQDMILFKLRWGGKAY